MATRILFLHHTAIIGGAELHLLAVARHFRATSTVVLFDDGPFRLALETAGVQVRVFPSEWAAAGVRHENPRLSPRNIASVLRLAWLTARSARGADLVYANSPKALLVSSIVRLVRRKPTIWFLHDLLDGTHFSPQTIRLFVIVANRTATRVLTNSKATADAFVSAEGRRDLVRVVYDGFDVARFSDTGVDLTALRAELNLKGSRVLGVFGRITPWKGQEVVLQALARVPLGVVLFVGEEDGDYANELRLLATKLGIAERVRFLGFRQDIPQLMRLVDCVVHASTNPEPFGRVIVEGMLAGRPVIATRAGGVPEIIEDGVSGILVPSGNPDELAAVIVRVLSDPAGAERLAQCGRARALEMFNEIRMLRETEQHVNEIVSAR